MYYKNASPIYLVLRQQISLRTGALFTEQHNGLKLNGMMLPKIPGIVGTFIDLPKQKNWWYFYFVYTIYLLVSDTKNSRNSLFPCWKKSELSTTNYCRDKNAKQTEKYLHRPFGHCEAKSFCHKKRETSPEVYSNFLSDICCAPLVYHSKRFKACVLQQI